MKNWLPIPGSKKEKIIQLALKEFNAKGYESVNIKELARMADMTTGVIYHHFGSKANLYELIRSDIEQRIIDRMEGVEALFDDPLDQIRAVLITGFTAAVKFQAERMLSEEHPSGKDLLSDYLMEVCRPVNPALIHILLPCWQSVLKGHSEGKLTLEEGKNLLNWMCR